MARVIRPLAVAGAVLLFASFANAQTPDHLQCFKIKDDAAKASYLADITPDDGAFPAAVGCSIRVPAKLLCVDAVKSNVTPPPPGAGDGAAAQKYLCYKTKCPKAQPTATLTDQFGSHGVTVKTTGLVCAPVPVAVSCSDTITNGSETDVDCGGGTCPTCANGLSCNTGSDCTSGACSTGICVSLLVNGAACSSGGQCSSGSCVDGVCCNTSCASTCQACTAVKKGAGADGSCGSIVNGSDPDSECSDSGAATCSFNGFCNGIGGCAIYAPGIECGAATCSAGVANAADLCDGMGSCQNGAATPCGNYACGPTTCNAFCASDVDCAVTAYCSAGGCLAKLSTGSVCSSNSMCQSGFCVDGFCCDGSCANTCESCAGAANGGADGICGFITAGTDPDNECAGSFVCDGAGMCVP